MAVRAAAGLRQHLRRAARPLGRLVRLRPRWRRGAEPAALRPGDDGPGDDLAHAHGLAGGHRRAGARAVAGRPTQRSLSTGPQRPRRPGRSGAHRDLHRGPGGRAAQLPPAVRLRRHPRDVGLPGRGLLARRGGCAGRPRTAPDVRSPPGADRAALSRAHRPAPGRARLRGAVLACAPSRELRRGARAAARAHRVLARMAERGPAARSSVGAVPRAQRADAQGPEL